MKFNSIEEYYNKFNENRRLKSRHGQVEFNISMRYLLKYLNQYEKPRIIDIGAGTGKYSIELEKMGFDVVAVELVKHNLEVLHASNPKIKAVQANALNLSMFESETFDIAILFGPMYHLFEFKDKLKALQEAKRITKKGGLIFVAYCLNDYSIITYAFIENHIKEVISEGKLTTNFITNTNIEDLYSYDTLDTINKLKDIVKLKREIIFSPDGPTDYIRRTVNNMDGETFKIYLNYIETISAKPELIGAGSHIVDVLKKE
ncbi:MAG TPA: class I SAM-dependent methyltransferase [Candidatus Onthoplasma faecipullorum]|nr:class I SAM-dependent methyltransferase [Candidatus Onthoplasma faecipullorum]